jgi:hypothetical protein
MKRMVASELAPGRDEEEELGPPRDSPVVLIPGKKKVEEAVDIGDVVADAGVGG